MSLIEPATNKPSRLIFALHFHQPYGNFGEVFEDAVARCYQPTLDLLSEHPHVRAAIHVSGPLLDWAEKYRPGMIDGLAKLVARDQVEILGGGYQEPMLAIIPDRDAIGQLTRMAERCEQLLGRRPEGMWLAERVWEPDLPRVIAAAGYRYTLLDDSHLRAAGAADPLGAYYVTDKSGDSVAVFPIDRGLRTRIPYANVDELIDYLRAQRGRTSTYGDDVEKFGLWPTTERRVWQNRWLEKFFVAMEAEKDWLEITTPGEILRDTVSSGSIYLPTISYAEMGAWALPPAASLRYTDTAARMHMAGFGDEADSFLRGGIWQAFLAKYPESGLIYRKMLRVSRAVEKARLAKHPQYAAARDLLYQSQCNCAYWHGLFGGLYLQHLRHALTSALIEAENLIAARQEVVLSREDHDGDLQEELLFETPALNLYVSPARGGSAFELDLRQARHHLTGVLGRREEAYHEDVSRAQVVSDEDLDNVSAHDLVRATEPGLAAKLIFDAFPRGAFVDHVLPADAQPDCLDDDYQPLADFANASYQLDHCQQSPAEGEVTMSCELDGYRLRKTIEVSKARVAVRYTLSATGPRRAVRLGCQVDVTLLSPESVGGRAIIIKSPTTNDPTPGAPAQVPATRAVQVVASSMGVDVTLTPSPKAELWKRPIETVSQSERGFEPSYQGTSLVFVFDGEVGANQGIEAEVELIVNS